MSNLNLTCPECGCGLSGVTTDMIGRTGMCQRCRARFENQDEPNAQPQQEVLPKSFEMSELLHFRCPYCDAHLKAYRGDIGKWAKCLCGALVHIDEKRAVDSRSPEPPMSDTPSAADVGAYYSNDNSVTNRPVAIPAPQRVGLVVANATGVSRAVDAPRPDHRYLWVFRNSASIALITFVLGCVAVVTTMWHFRENSGSGEDTQLAQSTSVVAGPAVDKSKVNSAIRQNASKPATYPHTGGSAGTSPVANAPFRPAPPVDYDVVPPQPVTNPAPVSNGPPAAQPLSPVRPGQETLDYWRAALPHFSVFKSARDSTLGNQLYFSRRSINALSELPTLNVDEAAVKYVHEVCETYRVIESVAKTFGSPEYYLQTFAEAAAQASRKESPDKLFEPAIRIAEWLQQMDLMLQKLEQRRYETRAVLTRKYGYQFP